MNKRVLSLLFVTLFVVMLGFSILFPIEAFYVKRFGADAKTMGILIMLYSLGQFVFSPIWGRLSDRVGRRPVLMLGLFGYAVAMALFGLSTQLWQLFVFRAMAGVLSAATLPTAMAVIADATDDENRTRGMGVLGAAFGLGVIFGPALGGLLGQQNLALPYFLTAGLAIANLIWVYFALPETLSPDRKGKGRAAGSGWVAFSRYTAPLYILSLLASFSLSALEATFGFMAAERLGLSPRQVGWLFTIMGFAGALVQGGLIGRLKTWFGESRLIVTGLLVSAAGLGLTATAGSALAASLALTVFSVGNGLVRPANVGLITRRAHVGHGQSIGLLNSFDSMGRILGPVTGGYLYGFADHLPFGLGVVLNIMAALLFLSAFRADNQKA